MKISPQMTDEAVLRELGERLVGARIERNLTQAALAEEAGVSKRTVERMESGEAATRLSGFLRVCRVLGLWERLDQFLPEPTPGPMALLQQQNRKRQRASGRRRPTTEGKKWTWGEPA